MLELDTFFTLVDSKYFAKFGDMPMDDTDGLFTYNQDGGEYIDSYADYHRCCVDAVLGYMRDHLYRFNYESIDFNGKTEGGSHNGVRRVVSEATELLMGMLDKDIAINVENVAWVNHLDHVGGKMLQDHSNIDYCLIDEISQEGIGNVFSDCPI